MISISAQRKRKPPTARNAPTPERLAKADAPVKERGRYHLPGKPDAVTCGAGAQVDLLKHWLARSQITPAQHTMGRRFQRLYERAALGADGSGPRDTSAGSCGRACTPPTPGATLARSELSTLKIILGEVDFRLLCNVLGQGRDMAAEAPALADGSAYVGRRIRDALHLMAMRGE